MVTHGPSLHAARQYEVLHLITLRRAGTTGPYLYWARCTVQGLHLAGDAASEELVVYTEDMTRFEDKVVPLQVLHRMAEIEGVKVFKGRDVAVSKGAWAELEAYMASPEAADGS